MKDTPVPESDKSLVGDFYNNTFNATTSLASLHLWALFGFLSVMISCDFKKWIVTNSIFKHFIGIIAFFFLFTIIDKDNKVPVYIVWIKTCIVYGAYLMMIKSKWYFSIPILLLLVIDQTVRAHYDYLKNKNPKDSSLSTLDLVKNNINIIVFMLIIVGFILYAIRQYNEYGSNFSFTTLLFEFGCKA